VRRTRLALACFFLAGALLGGCATLPDEPAAIVRQDAPAPAASGMLSEARAQFAQKHGAERSGFTLLDLNANALNWRLALVDSAVSSLDLMYYLWYAHDSGRLLLDRVVRAADRGVTVRLLVDDLLLIGSDTGLVALDQHPNIELRLFNPKRQRKAGMVLDTLARFGKMNQRMHNKLIVADNHAVILGGRNIGDEYFGLSESYNFHDLDVLGLGPVALQSSALFDDYWNSSWVVPVAALPAEVDEEKAAGQWRRQVTALANSDKLNDFPLQPRDWSAQWRELFAGLRPGGSEVVYDRPADDGVVRGMKDPLGAALRGAQGEICLVNAYIIPNPAFIEGIREHTARGVDVRILTNSLASHDVPAVNSHYRRWRRPLVEAGAELYEFRSDPAIKSRVDTAPVVSKFTGLHTKAFVVDGRRVFVGSMNFDPRSVAINTEMGIFIDSPDLATDLLQLAERDMSPVNAWRVGLDEDGDLIWSNSDETVTRQPARNAWQRVMDALFRLLPASQL
jgi:putative cardiolipin synthase